MTGGNFSEIRIVRQFMPEIFLLVGLIALGAQVVGLRDHQSYSLQDKLGSPVMRNHFYDDKIKRLSGDNTGHIAARVKRNLALLIIITIVMELLFNYSTGTQAKDFVFFSGTLMNKPMIVAMKLLVLNLALGIVLYADPYEQGLVASTLALIGTIVFFMLILVSAHNLVVFYVALEGVALLSFVLTAQSKSHTAVESGLKYFFQSSYASVLLLLGIAFLFASTQEFEFSEITGTMIQDRGDVLTELALSIMTIALLFKVSAFPGHFGAIDIYRGPVNAVFNFFAVSVKVTAFLAFFNIYHHFLFLMYAQMNGLLYISAVMSLLIGAIGAIRILNEAGEVRSFVAYTSINQVGFVLLGLVCMNAEGFVASFVYLLVYALSSLLFIGVLSRMRFGENGTARIQNLRQLKEIFADRYRTGRRLELFVIAYSIGSMAGLPPLAGFFGKVGLWAALSRKLGKLKDGASGTEVQYTFTELDLSDQIDPFGGVAGILAFSLIISIISAAYYFKFYELMSPEASKEETKTGQSKNGYAYSANDAGSILMNEFIMVVMLIWVTFVCGNKEFVPLAYLPQFFDVGGIPGFDDFNDFGL